MAQRIKILMVEDNQDHLDLCREYLPSDDFFLDEAKDGKEAFQKLKMNKYDIIILDYQLPDITGAELLKYIRERDKITPIIFVTAMDDPDISFHVLQVGASDYIHKTFQYYETLREKILKNLGIDPVKK